VKLARPAPIREWLGAVALAASIILPCAAAAQSDDGSCALKDHIYRCDGAAFQTALAQATTVSVQAHNADGVARAQLRELVTKRLGKSVVEGGARADLVFLIIPIEASGIVDGSSEADLGTLRIYTAAADGSAGHLLWAETYSGRQGTPWLAVVRGLIVQFRGRFHIA
jgi:hypothetical protein